MEHLNSKINSRLAISVLFFINGVLFANWVTRIPDIQANLSLSKSDLGLVLMAIPIGLIITLALVGGLIEKFGSKSITIMGTILMILILPFIAVMPTSMFLWINLLLFGSSVSIMDIAMNTQGIEVERQYQRSIMSSFHASYSVGGFTGAIIGFLLIRFRFNPLNHFMLISFIFFLIVFFTFRFLVETPDVSNDKISRPIRTFQFPPMVLWPLGAIVFASALGEGAMADWSAIYMIDVVSTNTDVAALGFAAFSLTMTFGRLIGDNLSNTFGSERTVRYGGIIATLGLFISVLLPNLVFVLFGFALIGLGLSIIIPLVYNAAGNKIDINSGVGIAGVATIGYMGFLIGPPLIGFISENFSLQMAFLIVGFVLTSLIYTSRSLSQKMKDF